jgi:hypothetical protein
MPCAHDHAGGGLLTVSGDKYGMRFVEFAIKPIKPLNPAQARVAALKRQVDQSKTALKREQDAQRMAKEHEQARKAQQPKR